MSNRSFITTASFIVSRGHRAWLGWLGVMLVCLPPIAGGDSYLDAIELEAGARDGDDIAEAGGGDSKSEDPRAAFELDLERRYRGSYLFYKKLPAKSQEEVFREFEGGASIEDVRKTIMNRFLHSR